MKFYGTFCFKLLPYAIGLSLLSTGAVKAQNNTNLQEVQEIIAIVNDKLISVYDLDQRTKLLALAGGRRTITREELDYIEQQAMQALIDDRLKLQEAAKYDAVMPEKDVIASYENYAGRFQMDPDELEKQLNSAGVKKNTLLEQIRGTMAWQSVVGGLLEQQVNITDDEVYNFIDNLERNKGKDQYRVSEIYFLVSDNAFREQARANAAGIQQQLNEGSPFAAMAQQFSQSSTAAVGGDLGWVMRDALPTEVNEILLTMNVGETSEPIETEDGIYVIQVTDRRQILTLNDNDIAVQLKHLLFATEDGADGKFEALNKKVVEKVSDVESCEMNDQYAAELGAKESGILGTFRIGELPIEIREEVLTLEEGAGTNLYQEPTGYRSFVLCGKEIPTVELPNYDDVLEDLTQSRVQLIAKRHLRDLRRDAIVDYR